MPSKATSHEAAQKKLWQKEVLGLDKQAKQIASKEAKEIKHAEAHVTKARRELAAAERDLARVWKRTGQSAVLRNIERRKAALVGRINA